MPQYNETKLFQIFCLQWHQQKLKLLAKSITGSLHQAYLNLSICLTTEVRDRATGKVLEGADRETDKQTDFPRIIVRFIYGALNLLGHPERRYSFYHVY